MKRKIIFWSFLALFGSLVLGVKGRTFVAEVDPWVKPGTPTAVDLVAQKWTGTIESRAGLKVVLNPARSVFGEVRYELDPVWVLGREKDENDFFANIYDVQVDAWGDIYVSDAKRRKVMKFGSDGKYLRDIGRMGQGPGEYQAARNIAVEEASGDIYLADLMKVHRFNRDGRYINDISVNGFFSVFFIDSKGALWARSSYPEEGGGSGEAFDKYSPLGMLVKRIKILTALQKDEKSPQTGENQFVTIVRPKHGYENNLFISRIDDRTCFWAEPVEYVLNVVDAEGNGVIQIQKQEQPESFSNQEKESILNRFNAKIRDQIVLPKYKPYFNKAFSDDTGRIYVRKVQSPLQDQGPYRYDIFSKDGHFLYESRFDEDPVIVKDGSFYSIVRDRETSYQLIKKYRIKNWDRIKKGIS